MSVKKATRTSLNRPKAIRLAISFSTAVERKYQTHPPSCWRQTSVSEELPILDVFLRFCPYSNERPYLDRDRHHRAFSFEKGKTRGGSNSVDRPKSRKTAFFPRNARPYAYRFKLKMFYVYRSDSLEIFIVVCMAASGRQRL